MNHTGLTYGSVIEPVEVNQMGRGGNKYRHKNVKLARPPSTPRYTSHNSDNHNSLPCEEERTTHNLSPAQSGDNDTLGKPYNASYFLPRKIIGHAVH